MLSGIVFFIELMYPQNDKMSVLEVLEIQSFFAAQLCWADLLTFFCKVLSTGFTLVVSILGY